MRIRPSVAAVLLACGLSLLAQQPSSQTKGKQPYVASDPGAFPLGETQGTGRIAAPPPSSVPAPHLPDGRPDFGGDGAWYPGFHGNLAETQWKGARSADRKVDVPFLPSSLQIFNTRVETNAKDDPEAQCLPVGVPRYMFDPYPFKMLQLKDRVMFFFEGDNYPWREVVLGKKTDHPKNIQPSWMGDSVGWYEGDTLVVDVIGFNDKSWLDQAGHSHSDKMHLTERYTRTDMATLKYEVTIDDPGAYTKPWTAYITVRWRPGFKLFEYVCDENEKDSRHMTKNAK